MTQTEERLEAMKQKVANGPIPRKQVQDQNGLQARMALVERLWNERRVMPESNTTKKRMSRKDRLLEGHQSHPPQQPPPPNPPPPIIQNHQDDGSKRPRIISMHCQPAYSIGMAPGWGHYPQ